jgi:hypothetical protein
MNVGGRGRNETETETGPPSVRTDDGLRTALLTPPGSGGWEGPLGLTVLAEVVRRAAREARY